MSHRADFYQTMLFGHRRLRLLKTEGTIPVHYQGSKYNIPILVWIMEHYPLQVCLVGQEKLE